MKTKAKCVDCGSSEVEERNRCEECAKKYSREKSKKYYANLKKLGIKRGRYGIINCAICKEEMIKNRPNQVAHGECKKKEVVSYNDHPRDKGGMMLGRRVVLDLGIKIAKGIIVHHIDENPINNSFKNLMIMSVENHGRLHSFLREQWIINKGVYGDKLESVWKKILIKLNFVWIKKVGVELIKINPKDLSETDINKNCIYMIYD
jgi:hypothetical protein